MNDFDGVNTGKWWVKEEAGLYEAECSVCGYCRPVAVGFSIETLTTEIRGLDDHCPSCNENMFKEEPQLFTEEPACVVGNVRAEPRSKSLVIDCEKIILEQRSLGITVDISENIDNIDAVEINGVKFIREV